MKDTRPTMTIHYFEDNTKCMVENVIEFEILGDEIFYEQLLIRTTDRIGVGPSRVERKSIPLKSFSYAKVNKDQ